MAPLEIRHRSVRPISAKHAQASRFLQQSPGRCEMNAGQRGEIVRACVALRELPHPVTALILIREDRSDKNRLITFDEISTEKRSEAHTAELQYRMSHSYAVFS